MADPASPGTRPGAPQAPPRTPPPRRQAATVTLKIAHVTRLALTICHKNQVTLHKPPDSHVLTLRFVELLQVLSGCLRLGCDDASFPGIIMLDHRGQQFTCLRLSTCKLPSSDRSSNPNLRGTLEREIFIK